MVSLVFSVPRPRVASASSPHQVFVTWPSLPSAAGVSLKLPLARRRASR